MKNIGVITLNDNNNFGNRLQNYAVEAAIKKCGYNPTTIRYKRTSEKSSKYMLKLFIKYCINFTWKRQIIKKKKLFKKFNFNINETKKVYTIDNIRKSIDVESYIVGSDQVWNPNFKRLTDIELLKFTNKNKIAFSASFGIGELPKEYWDSTKTALNGFKAISVREDAGKKIIEELGVDKDVQVLVDPTMLLSADDWDKVSNKPKNINDGEKYILNYFLGKLPDEWDKEIKRIAKENDCRIINILDESDPYFVSGPSEFLYLEKNAFLVCTDSFHSSVFSIIYDTPFVVFNRKDKHVSMNSRLDTLLSKFELENRKFNGSISNDLLKCDYSNAKKILEKEKEKSKKFLCKALDIDE